jgi:uncharacterized protein (TIGR02598 family)
MNARMLRRPDRTGAFSLVEVTLAMALVSFAVITIIGLLPVGLNALHRVIDTTEEAQIVRQIGAQAVLTPYSTLSATFSGQTFYYDQDGVLLTNSPAPMPAATRYRAATTVVTPVYPGSTGAAALSGNMSTVHIVLMDGPGTVASSTNFYNVEVPNSGN